MVKTMNINIRRSTRVCKPPCGPAGALGFRMMCAATSSVQCPTVLLPQVRLKWPRQPWVLFKASSPLVIRPKSPPSPWRDRCSNSPVALCFLWYRRLSLLHLEEDKRATTNVQTRFALFLLLSFLLFCYPWAKALCFEGKVQGENSEKVPKSVNKCEKLWNDFAL